jgi:antitoxin component YwqK of YwqJK toxin-antitoxin module
MKQFTSRLDFSVTKKRLNMLSRKASKTKMLPKALFVIPVFSILTLMFCADSELKLMDQLVDESDNIINTDSELIESKNYFASGPNPVFADTTLYVRKNEIDTYRKKLYTDNGILFTGKQNWFYEASGDLDQTLEIQEGVIINATRFNGDGSEFLKKITIYDNSDTTYIRYYKHGILESTSKEWSYQEGAIVYYLSNGIDSEGNTFNSIETKSLTNTINEIAMFRNGLPMFQSYRDEELYTMKSYYYNGTLRSDATAKNNGNSNYFAGDVILHGLQTQYDEQGNITKQELYENGELIETIVELDE